MDNTAYTITLADGRTLGFAEYDDPRGTPVMYFTGGNSSRLEGAWFDAAARQQGVRLIATDRPGFGLSDYQPERTLLDWPDDVAQLADALDMARFAVMGLSGGGPHVAAVAYRLPERLTGAAIVSGASPYAAPGTLAGMWPPLRLMYFVARRAPFGLVARLQGAMNDPDNLIKNKHRLPSAADVALLTEKPEVAEVFRRSQVESMRNGVRGAAQEWQLYTRPWGFPLEAITVPIRLWYGEEDGNAPPGMGRYLASKIADSHLTIVPNAGHFSLIHNHIDAILSELLIFA